MRVAESVIDTWGRMILLCWGLICVLPPWPLPRRHQSHTTSSPLHSHHHLRKGLQTFSDVPWGNMPRWLGTALSDQNHAFSDSQEPRITGNKTALKSGCPSSDPASCSSYGILSLRLDVLTCKLLTVRKRHCSDWIVFPEQYVVQRSARCLLVTMICFQSWFWMLQIVGRNHLHS